MQKTLNVSGTISDAERLATALISRFTADERLVVWSSKNPEWVLIRYAFAISGLRLLASSPAFKPRELTEVVEQSGAVSLILAVNCVEIQWVKWVPQLLQNLKRFAK